MKRPKLIILSGFAASGKTTVGKLYLKDHPLALLIEGDELIVNLGQWLEHESEARHIVQEYDKSLVRTQLGLGYDVIWPILLTDATHVTEVEVIAKENNADVFEFLFDLPREVAIDRLLKRGVWGEAGLPRIGEEELPRIHELYDKMTSEMVHRPNAIKVDVEYQNPVESYNQITDHLHKSEQ